MTSEDATPGSSHPIPALTITGRICGIIQSQPLAGVGQHHPVVWTVQYGDGRVFSIAIGHSPDQMGPDFAALFTRGAEWAATGRVTLPVPEMV
jgi:type 1 glutamine amidotransferase